jgi:hypothetical protein
MRRECLITSRLAGPCACCRQPAWPAHVRGLLIYCEACCGCACRCRPGPRRGRPRHDAAPGKPSKAGPRGHEALAAGSRTAENMERASRGWRIGGPGEGFGYYPAPGARFWGAGGPARAIVRGDPRGAAPWPGRCQLPSRRCRPPACRHAACRRGRVRLPPPALPPQPPRWPAGPRGRQVPAALRGETFPRQNVLAETL